MRITRLGLFNVVLATVLLTSTFLMNAKLTTSVRQYDPWVDYNGDGTVNYLDVYSLLIAYGMSGDPTKNVTIVGHATKLLKPAVSASVPPSSSWESGLILIDGYSKVTVLLNVYPPGYSNQLVIYAYDYRGLAGTWALVENVIDIFGSWMKTYDVMNQQIRIIFNNPSVATLTLNLDVYLVA